MLHCIVFLRLERELPYANENQCEILYRNFLLKYTIKTSIIRAVHARGVVVLESPKPVVRNANDRIHYRKYNSTRRRRSVVRRIHNSVNIVDNSRVRFYVHGRIVEGKHRGGGYERGGKISRKDVVLY